jgi:hypothetical protein
LDEEIPGTPTTWGEFVAKKQEKNEASEKQILGFLGVGLDNKDGHQRLTRADNFLLVGGSEETHERMQDTAMRFGEKLRSRGKTLKETPVDEAIDLLRESLEG